MKEREDRQPVVRNAQTARPVAEVRDVVKDFGATRALDRVSLSLGHGETRALVGRNGAGKSTLVNILTGLVRADRGEVRFAGRPAPGLGDREQWQRLVACVYQSSTLLPDLTVGENLFLNAYPRSRSGLINWKLLRERAEQVLDEWGITVPPTLVAHRLRVEERQQVEIARALASGSRFLILDEPTARLEAPAIRRLFEHITRLREAGVSILYISHHLSEIYEVCDTVTVLRDGKMVRSGRVDELPKPALVGAMIGEPGKAGEVTGGKPVAPKGRTRRATAEASRDQGLSVDRLSITGWCSQITFQVRSGELVGLAGLASSGKAQVAEAIAGLRDATGCVQVGGEAVRPGDPGAAITSGIGFVPQDRHAEGLASNLSVEENLTLNILSRLGRSGFVSPRIRRKVAERAMRSMGVVASSPGQSVVELSGGNQQKVVLGRALLTDPRVLVVVNPTAGVDIASKQALFETLGSLSGVAVLVASDELDELSHCDRVLVMVEGRVTREFKRWEEHELVAAIEGVDEDEGGGWERNGG